MSLDPVSSATRERIAEFLAMPASLARLELSVVHVPQREVFRSAVGVRRERQALFVRWVDADGAWGIGECSCRPDPFFSGEFVDGAVAVIREHVFARLPRAGTVGEVAEALARVRGWPFTVAAVLDAVFDLLRRAGCEDLLDGWPGIEVGSEPLSRVPVGISLGLFDSPQAAVARVARAVAEGYRRVKLKVAPTMKVATAEAVREAFPGLALGFDANGSCEEGDFDLLLRLARLSPVSLEQPFAPRRLDLHAALLERLPELPVCLDESVTGLGDLVAAHRLGALAELNLKPGRVGGQVETVRLVDYCARHAIPAWVGGMFETGVGRLQNLRVAARLPGAQAHDQSPSLRYFTRDVVRLPFTMSADGFTELGAGRPVELDEQALAELTVRSWTLDKGKE
jgi:O-succinylbenzoate synthase